MRNMIFILFVVLFCNLPVQIAHANPNALQDLPQALKNSKLVGQGLFSFMFWDLYTAKLYAPDGVLDKNKPFVLQLEYLRDLSGRRIADKSIEEIRGQGFSDEIRLADWHNQIQAIFPDVRNGETITGVAVPDVETIFYHGTTEIGRVKDGAFTKHFFDIWLSEQTSAPELRMSLLGAL